MPSLSSTCNQVRRPLVKRHNGWALGVSTFKSWKLKKKQPKLNTSQGLKSSVSHYVRDKSCEGHGGQNPPPSPCQHLVKLGAETVGRTLVPSKEVKVRQALAPGETQHCLKTGLLSSWKLPGKA